MISIITPVYNGERFIETCLQTVIDQRCELIEHIIVDGHSTDQTISIVQQYINRYSHIRCMSEPDRGQSDAMNKGISIAHGSIIGFLNVDDYYEPDILNRVLDLFRTLPEPSFAIANCNIWDDHDRLIEINKPAKLRLIDLVQGLNITPFPCNPSAYFYHRSLHDQIGHYAIDDHYAMDLDFILRAVQVANMVYVNETWGNYRRIEGTKTFIDIASGNGDRRILQIMKQYRRQLSASERVKILILKLDRARQFLVNLPVRAVRKLLRSWH